MTAPVSDSNRKAAGAPTNPGRRAVLKAGAAAGGALLLGFYLPLRKGVAARAPGGRFEPNAFIRIDKRGAVTLVMPQVEMGQGIYTAVAMILAEELDVAMDQVVLEHAPPDDKLYLNPAFGFQATGGSTSVRAFWIPLRKAGASARSMLVQAAANTWNTTPANCHTERGEVISASGQRLSYGVLIDSASRMAPPNDPSLKPANDFKLIGQPLKRIDTPEKVNGKVTYSMDVMLPGMKFAALAICPEFGGKVGRVDDSKAKRIPGVRQVVVLDDLVAVIGDHMWAAKRGVEMLDIAWKSGPHAAVDSDEVWKQLRAASSRDGAVAKSIGDITKGMSQGEPVEAEYELPFLAHATMEPPNCTVHVKPGSCEVWVGTQVMARAQSVAAKVTGLPLEKVVVHNHLIGGGFGRRLEIDFVERAVQVGQKVEGPVKVVYTREQDIAHDMYRPAYHYSLAATMSNGRIVAWRHKVSGSSILARWLPPAFQKGVDGDAVDGAIDVPYDLPNLRVEYVQCEPPGVPTSWWRGVGANGNWFAIESFIDELARRAGKDPVEFRRSMLASSPRMRAVMELVVDKAGWGQPVRARRGGRTGRGIGLQFAFGSYIATVTEAEVDELGEVRVHRVVSAVDTGIVVNPDTVIAQIQGGLMFGIEAALYGEVTIAKGRVEQSNFHDYRVLRLDQAPAIEVHLVPSSEAPGGIGEAGTTAGAPALRNAIFAATGIPLRRLPIDREVLAGRKDAVTGKKSA